MSLVKYGLVDCYEGFGFRLEGPERVSCQDLQPGNVQGSSGSLTMTPNATLSPAEVVDELNLLMTSGRLSSESLAIIEQAYVVEESLNGHDLASIKAQQLILTTPEFHTTGRVTPNPAANRTEPSIPAPSSNPYKAVVFLMLSGGCDSYNMIVPHKCHGNDLVDQYQEERGDLRLRKSERKQRVLDVANQPCQEFGLHPELKTIEQMYNDGDLIFFFNAGLLNAPTSKDNYSSVTESTLFAHNIMQTEATRCDPFNLKLRSGILGRLADALLLGGYQPDAISIDVASDAITGHTDQTRSPTIVSRSGVKTFHTRPSNESASDIKVEAVLLNGVQSLNTSNIFSETWAARFSRALWETDALETILEPITLPIPPPNTITLPTPPQEKEADKFEMILKLMMTRDHRGSDRDVFYMKMGGFDHHNDMKARLEDRFQELDRALEWFHHHLQQQNLWDNVTIVVLSEFGRTLNPNSNEGSDHGWGGHYFITGGAVNGRQALCNYPSDLTESGPWNLGRGRMLPGCSWESIWHPILQWMFDGNLTQADADSILVNAKNTGTVLYNISEVYE